MHSVHYLAPTDSSDKWAAIQAHLLLGANCLSRAFYYLKEWSELNNSDGSYFSLQAAHRTARGGSQIKKLAIIPIKN